MSNPKTDGRMIRKSIPIHLQYAVIERDGNVCQYCGKQGVKIRRFAKPAVVEIVNENINLNGLDFYNGDGVIKFEIDHIIPVFKGGENIIDNLILSCRKCNRAKGWR